MTVQKFETFEDLKSVENKISENHTVSMKKHDDFKKVIVDIRSVKVQQYKLTKSKQ